MARTEAEGTWDGIEKSLGITSSSTNERWKHPLIFKLPGTKREPILDIRRRLGLTSNPEAIGYSISFADFGIHLAETGASLVIINPDGTELKITNAQLREGFNLPQQLPHSRWKRLLGLDVPQS